MSDGRLIWPDMALRLLIYLTIVRDVSDGFVSASWQIYMHTLLCWTAWNQLAMTSSRAV